MPGTKGTHDSNLSAKVGLRRRIPKLGWIWVPFCGFGEVQQIVGWSPARIAGCDLDRDAVAHWQKTWPDAEVRCVDVEKFAFDAREYAVADVDAFGNPWRAVEHFLSDAHTARRVVVLATDGLRQMLVRGKRPYNFQTHRFEQMASLQARNQERHWEFAVTEWITSLGWMAIKATMRYGVEDGGKIPTAAVRYFRFELERTEERRRQGADADDWGVVDVGLDDIPDVDVPDVEL